MGIHNTIIFASFDSSLFDDPESAYLNSNLKEFNFLNTPPASITFTISSTTAVNGDRIQFSTNGIDGFAQPLSTFNIPKINFVNQKIYFVAKVKSLSGAPRKNYKKIINESDVLSNDAIISTHNEPFLIEVDNPETQLDIILQDGGTLESEFAYNYGDLIDKEGGGYLKGYVIPKEPGNNLRLKLVHKNDTLNLTVSGVSNLFNVFPDTGEFNIRKIDEDNNQSQNLKDLCYQSTLIDKPNLFDSFLGQIVGTDKDSPETIGIKFFEKTSNFVSNIADPDYSNLKSLVSQLKNLNITFEEYNQQFPPSLTRIVDILSIGVSRQRGGYNQFQLNFDDKGYSSKIIFGKNKGELLPVATTILKTGPESKNIIALEKFSDEYTVVNTNILSATNVDYIDTDSYPLSSYNDTWGWGLVLPNNYELSNYYEFYDFVDTIEGSLLQKFIDFDNNTNTYLTALTSIEDYSKKWGIAENVISHNLYTNLSLISGS